MRPLRENPGLDKCGSVSWIILDIGVVLHFQDFYNGIYNKNVATKKDQRKGWPVTAQTLVLVRLGFARYR